ncbi:MAG: FmdB family transcriptional regulator [Microbacteriaceae bacterium]|nr:FmdB family transcriptional regulator [Microbacteriaceae bacterium]
MPTYSYRCTECGTAFDIQQAFTDDSLTECPQVIDGRVCGGRLRKLFNSVGVTFNGSGFYRTDSRAEKSSGESKPAEKKETSAPAPAAASASAPAAAPATSSASASTGT